MVGVKGVVGSQGVVESRGWWGSRGGSYDVIMASCLN